MQSKLENLNATNALTKEDLTICKKALFKAQEENHKLLNQLEIANRELSIRKKRSSGNSEAPSSSTSDSHSSTPSTSADRSISKVKSLILEAKCIHNFVTQSVLIPIVLLLHIYVF